MRLLKIRKYIIFYFILFYLLCIIIDLRKRIRCIRFRNNKKTPI